MSIKTIVESGVLSKLLYTVAASAVIGGGTVVLNSQTRLAVLENTSVAGEHRLVRVEDKLDKIDDKLTIILQQGIDTKSDRDAHPRR
jgi:hypothetical protein